MAAVISRVESAERQVAQRRVQREPHAPVGPAVALLHDEDGGTAWTQDSVGALERPCSLELGLRVAHHGVHSDDQVESDVGLEIGDGPDLDANTVEACGEDAAPACINHGRSDIPGDDICVGRGGEHGGQLPAGTDADHADPLNPCVTPC